MRFVKHTQLSNSETPKQSKANTKLKKKGERLDGWMDGLKEGRENQFVEMVRAIQVLM